jgi:hypothetical protein
VCCTGRRRPPPRRGVSSRRSKQTCRPALNKPPASKNSGAISKTCTNTRERPENAQLPDAGKPASSFTRCERRERREHDEPQINAEAYLPARDSSEPRLLRFTQLRLFFVVHRTNIRKPTRPTWLTTPARVSKRWRGRMKYLTLATSEALPSVQQPATCVGSASV